METNPKHEEAKHRLLAEALIRNLNTALAEWQKETGDVRQKIDALNAAAKVLHPDRKLDADILPLQAKCIAIQFCMIAVQDAIMKSQREAAFVAKSVYGSA